MASKLQAYAQMADHAAHQITGSYQEWTAFLSTAGRLYKYPYPEQLLIHAQRPNATACAEYDFWNQRMRRYVRRGAKGIALIENSGGRPFLRYVFDVADTGGGEDTRPKLWRYQNEYQNVVSSALKQRYDVSGSDLAEQFEKIAAQLAGEYWNDHRQDILRIVDGSFLEEYDEFNIGTQFRNAAAVSIAYTLMSRCGLKPESYFEHEDFLSIFDFNTPDTITELGTAVSQGSETVLRQIEITIKKYEREKTAGRSMEYGEQSDLHPSGRLPDSQSGPAGAAGPRPGQIRENAPDVPEGAPSRAVQPPDTERDAVQPLSGDRGHGQQPSGADDAAVGEGGGGHGAVESQRSDEVGGADEHLQGTGGGNYHVGADLQLGFMPPEIPSQREQMETIREAESADAPSAFSVSQAEVEQYLSSHQAAERSIHVPGATMTPREITQADIDAALQEWNGDIASKRRVQQYMTGHARDRDTAEWLKNEYGDGLPAFPVTVEGAATDLPWTKVQRHLARLVKEDRFFTEEELDNFEDIDAAAIREHLEQDSPSEFVEQVVADAERLAGQDSSTAPTIRETYNRYKPIIRDLVLADVAYQNACKNSDRENAIIEGDAAVKRAALTITEPEFMRLYHDMPNFRYRLHREIVDETYAALTQPQQEQQTAPPHAMPDTTGYEEETPPWGTEIGDHSPWGKVQRSDQFADGVYEVSTARHGGIMIRETDAKKLLSPETLAAGGTEYGWCYYEEDEAASVVIRELLDRGIPAVPPYVCCEFSETGVFKAGKIYSVHEFDRLMKQADDKRVAGKKAAIKKYGTEQRWIESKDPEFDEFFGYDKVSFVIVLPDGVRVWGRQDVGDGYGGLLDYLRQNEKYRDIVPILQQAAEREQARFAAEAAPPDPSGQPVTHEADITVSDEDRQNIQEVIGAADQPPHDPLSPPYKPGDIVYLQNTAFEIGEIGIFDVQLRDPSLPIPLLRTENKQNFERLLHLDTRNGRITSYLPADMSRVNDDFREVLTKHLLTDRDKGYISQWLRSGENNRGISMRLSETFASRAETVTLETGDIADYFTSTISMEVEIQDKFGTKLAQSWEAVAPILRALWLQELDGFSHEPVQREPVNLEGKLSYQVGDKVAFAYGDHDVNGTIEHIGDLGIRIHTGPYAWSHQLVEKDFFEDAVRHDERNAGLFTPEVPEQVAQKAPAPVVPEPGAISAAGNFRITDDSLGVGSPKEKFRRNMDAINTLKGIELEGRSATSAEQEVLSRYVGWGGLPDAFDPDKPKWADEFLELQAALTPEEYASARASTLNAHFTRPAIIRAIYEVVENMGFRTGNILEPSCGVGNFFGLLPESMAASKLYGVELDSVSGRIAQQLYPKANIDIRGFEKSDFPDGFFDLAIGNVPFGNYSLADRRYDKEHFLIHDYFFAKTIDKVRAGGVIAFVTSNGVGGGTMDKKDRRAREYIARRCDLLGAVRLPSNASLANAGTEAGMDIVFLQKRDMPRSLDEPLPEWTEVDTVEEHTYTGGDGREKRGFVTMNRYFQAHPEMVLGNLEITSGPFGPQLECKAIPGADLAQQLHEAVSHIHGEYREAAPPELDENIGEMEITSIPADPDVKNYSYAIVDGEVYYRENSVMVKPNLTATAKERVTAMIGLRDCVRELIDLQMDEFTTENFIWEKQGELDRLYDAFSAKFGLINDRANRLAFDQDSSYYLLCSLEVLDDDGRLERKADMFTKRTIKQNTRVTSVDTAMDALAVSIGERARVDMPFMAQLTGKSEAELEQELTGVIFRDIRCAENPDHIPKAFADLDRYPFVTADEYLSGKVRQKLRMAQAFYSVLPPEQQQRVRPNVEALTAAQPKDLDASEIEVRLGTDCLQ